MNNKKIGLMVLGLVVLVAVFYGGMVYGKSQMPARGMRGMGSQAFSGVIGGRNGGGFTTGQIISKDDTSITVSVTGGGPASPSQGGSKIIFLGSNTKVSKSTAGTIADLATGTEVLVMGTPNADGSINATTVQIRTK